MSNQPSTSQQPAPASSHDWSQATNMDLEVHMSDLEGTERAKEAEKSRQEAAKRECRVEACHQKAEEARLERERKEQEEHERQEWERREREEHERLEREEQERQEALAAARRAAVAEVEVARQSVAKEKGHVGELQSESRGSSVGSSGQVAAYSPMTGASMARGGRKRKKKCSWAMVEEVEVEAAVSGSRKRARMGGSRGSGRKKGWTDEEDNNDNEIEEVLGPAASRPEASGLGLVGEESEFGGSGQGVPGPLYDERMLVIQARQAAVMEHQALAMERMAGAMEAQVVVVHVYMQRQPVFPPWPPGGLVGVAPVTGQTEAGGNGSGAWEERAGP
ncbi:hypothetical protein EV401DRAFT_1895854 [Pisolithus croceorrhizus]|nr:hypothetical protein EV401DRAFT_1895854 [Pisolithus croceorrhizus]